jgi:hypothetical protein
VVPVLPKRRSTKRRLAVELDVPSGSIAPPPTRRGDSRGSLGARASSLASLGLARVVVVLNGGASVLCGVRVYVVVAGVEVAAVAL